MAKILWADDEIDLLKPYILFLHNKGYEVTTVNSGSDALDYIPKINFDIVFLDENMPGLTGLETLVQLKQMKPNLPVVMITKSEEEHIMEEAIGSQIADYLIKPLNPNQILLSVKKILDKKNLIDEKINQSYQQEFKQLMLEYQDNLEYEQWGEIYKKLVFWELAISNTEGKEMAEILEQQKMEANHNFSTYIRKNYENWLKTPSQAPILSHNLLRKKVFPLLKPDLPPLYFLLIDNFRYDQWKIIEPLLLDYFSVEEESFYYSILPTATGYARNSIFAGELPLDIYKQYPNYWVHETESEEKLNNYEEELLGELLKKSRLPIKWSYKKILNQAQGKSLLDSLNQSQLNTFNVVVYNFLDTLSHARTDTAFIKELAPDEAAYRSLTQSWFSHSTLLEWMKKIAEKKGRIIISTDHGMIRVKHATKIIGDRSVNSNLRYKQGKNLNWEDENKLYVVNKPQNIGLPQTNLSTYFVFALSDNYLIYPNNFNQFAALYNDTFQHGGISLEEMVVPFISLVPK